MWNFQRWRTYFCFRYNKNPKKYNKIKVKGSFHTKNLIFCSFWISYVEDCCSDNIFVKFSIPIQIVTGNLKFLRWPPGLGEHVKPLGLRLISPRSYWKYHPIGLWEWGSIECTSSEILSTKFCRYQKFKSKVYSLYFKINRKQPSDYLTNYPKVKTDFVKIYQQIRYLLKIGKENHSQTVDPIKNYQKI